MKAIQQGHKVSNITLYMFIDIELSKDQKINSQNYE